MTKYEDLIKQRKKKSTSLETIFRKYKMTVGDVQNIQEEIEKVKKEADRLMINKIKKYENEINELKSKVHAADTETALIKATGMNSPEMKAAKEEINSLKNKIADLTEAAQSKDYFRDPDYKYLIEENRKLEEERNELLMDNKKLAAQVADKVNQLRKSGM